MGRFGGRKWRRNNVIIISKNIFFLEKGKHVVGMENSCDWALERLKGFWKLFSDPASYCT